MGCLLTMLVLVRLTKKHIISTKNNDRTNITIIMIAIVHSIYSQSVHAPALDAGLMTLTMTLSGTVYCT